MFREWRKHSGTVRDQLEISANFKGWSERSNVKLTGLPKPPRYVDVVDCAWAHRVSDSHPDATVRSLTENYWANPSQGIQRLPWTLKGGCLTPRACWYSFEKECCLDGSDYLRIQGLPTWTELNGLSDNEVRDLGGDVYPCPLIATALLSLYYQPWACWWKEDIA